MAVRFGSVDVGVDCKPLRFRVLNRCVAMEISRNDGQRTRDIRPVSPPAFPRIRILHLEDNREDHELIRDSLEMQGIEIDFVWVRDRAGFEQAICNHSPDLILADYSIPGFDGLSALRQSRIAMPEVPFVFVSGTIGEERAVTALKEGATNYVAKGNLNRLPAVIRGALADVEQKGAKQKEAEAKLVADESRFRPLVEQSIVGIYVIQDDRFAYVNPKMTQIFGYTAEELTSRPILDFVRVEDRELVRHNIAKRLSGDVESLQYELRALGFGDRPINVQVHGARAEYGGQPSILGIMLDVTERRQAEDRLREQAALLDHAQDAILVRDLTHRITYWNKSAERIYGWSAEETIGRRIQDLFDPDPVRFQQAHERTLQSGEWFGEILQRTKEGREITVEAHWTLVRGQDGAPRAILDINTDVTEKKRIEQQFLRAQRIESIGALAGGVAHDLNNVLAPIMMAVDLLKMQFDGADAAKILNSIRASAERGAHLVKQLLTFARGADGNHIAINALHVVREIHQTLGHSFPKSIEFRLNSTPRPWTVVGDATQLHQVFLNLCVNARDAMQRGGILEVKIENIVLDETYSEMNIDARPGPYLLISVGDTGSGIPPEIRERIFEPFFTTKESGKGTGLGLSTTMAIVKRHGGFLNLYSEVGKGTTFKVYLPADPTMANSESAPPPPSGLPRGRGELILLVDDEEVVRNVAQKTLERFGYRVLLACHGAEALGMYVQHRAQVSAVVTDMEMPIMDGPALVLALRTINPEVRIIGSSGHTSNGNVAAAIGAGLEFFIPKPYTAEALLKMLDRVFQSGSATGNS